MDIVESREFSPIAVTESIGVRVAERKAGVVGMGADWRTTAARVASASGMATVVALDEMGLNGRPNYASVEAGLPAARIWAAALGQSAIYLPETAGEVISSVKEVRGAWCPHPRHGIAARRASAGGAEDGIVASEQDV